MKLRILIGVASILAVVSGPVLARHCPEDMKKIDAALASGPKLSDAARKEVKRLRAEGEKLHKEGKHPRSEETLAKAMKILKI